MQAPVEGIITQRFGENAFEENGASDYRVFGLAGHNGLDYGVSEGTAVHCAAAGVVRRASMDGSGYGLHVRVKHGSDLLTLYGHLSRLNVAVGQEVQAGDVLGWSGNTGNSSGPHLHFEVRQPGGPDGYNGAVDPWSLLYGTVERLYQVRVLAEPGVNLRSQASKAGAIVGSAVRGTALDVYAESGGWVKVSPAELVWACLADGGETLLERVGEQPAEGWAEAIDRWARSLGYTGPGPG